MALSTVTIDICFYYNEHKAYLEGKLHLSKLNRQLNVSLNMAFGIGFGYLNATSKISTYVTYIEMSLLSLSMSAVILFPLLLKTRIGKGNISLGTALSFWSYASFG